MPKAVLLLSGGLDSSTLLALAQRDGYDVHALTFRYGQRHAHEVAAATKIAASRGVTRHVVIDIDLRRFGGSALTSDIPVPHSTDEKSPEPDVIPLTYVPARNTIFLSLALAWAEVLSARDIFIGVNSLDYSGYPDCRPEFVAAFEAVARLATRAGVEGAPTRIRAPLINMTKAGIITLGSSLDVDYSLTTSCYDPAADLSACGTCDACRIRLAGFRAAGLSDPITYSGPMIDVHGP